MDGLEEKEELNWTCWQWWINIITYIWVVGMGCDTVCGGVKHDFISMSSSVRWRISQSFGTASQPHKAEEEISKRSSAPHVHNLYIWMANLSLPPSPLDEVLFSPSGVLQQPPHQYVTRCQSGRSFTATCAEEEIILLCHFLHVKGSRCRLAMIHGSGMDGDDKLFSRPCGSLVRPRSVVAHLLLLLPMDEWMTWNGVGYGKNKCRISWLVKAHVIYNCSTDQFSTIVEGSAIRFSPEPVVHCPHHSIQYCMYCRFQKLTNQSKSSSSRCRLHLCPIALYIPRAPQEQFTTNQPAGQSPNNNTSCCS